MMRDQQDFNAVLKVNKGERYVKGIARVKRTRWRKKVSRIDPTRDTFFRQLSNRKIKGEPLREALQKTVAAHYEELQAM